MAMMSAVMEHHRSSTVRGRMAMVSAVGHHHQERKRASAGEMRVDDDGEGGVVSAVGITMATEDDGSGVVSAVGHHHRQ